MRASEPSALTGGVEQIHVMRIVLRFYRGLQKVRPLLEERSAWNADVAPWGCKKAAVAALHPDVVLA